MTQRPWESYSELVRRRMFALVAAGVPFDEAREVAMEQAAININQRFGSLVERMRAVARNMKR